MGGGQQPNPRGEFRLACPGYPHTAFHRDVAAVINDETVVESSEVGRELVLLAQVRPAVEARITLRLSDVPDGGCRVEMTEVTVSRPLRWIPDSLQLLGVARPAIGNAPGGWRGSRRSRTPMPSSSGPVVDAVVIGAGHNGLVAAAMLADAGWDVLVLEAQSEPGGAVRSAELFAGLHQRSVQRVLSDVSGVSGDERTPS